MLASIAPASNDFQELADYLVHGKDKPTHPKRVAWTFAHNLPTNDPELAADLMTATAHLSPRTKKAAYHLMIAWHPSERPSPEIMQEIARRTLELADLGEHQAFVMGHGDKPHDHLHMLINRVHPVTGKAWKTSHDFARFDRIMQLLADEYGFEHVPTHTYDPEQTDDQPQQPKKRATYAAKQRGSPRRATSTASTPRSPRSSDVDRPYLANRDARELGDQLSERLDQATTWDDIVQAFEEQELELVAKAKGLVAIGARAKVKFSRLGLQTSAKGFERRFEQSFAEWHDQQRAGDTDTARRLLAVDGVDIVKAFATLGLTDQDDVKAAVHGARSERQQRLAAKPLTQQLRQALQASTSLKPTARRKPLARASTPAKPPSPGR